MNNIKIDVIANSGLVNLDTEFEMLFSRARSVDIATAFISSSSIKLIRNYLKKDDRKLNLIIGLYGGFNSKKDLQELNRLANNKSDKFQCRISRNPLFHWKYYSFIDHKSITKFVGSANFTRNGMNNPGELTLKLVGDSKTRELRILNSEFKKLWDKDSLDIREFPLVKYRSRQRKIIDSPGFVIGKDIRSLLNYGKKPDRKNSIKTKTGSCYLDVISSYASRKTKKIIFGKKSNWEKWNYTFITSHRKKDFDIWLNSKYILQFEIMPKRKRVGLFEVMDHTEFQTEDGNYFVALRRVRNTPIKQLDAIQTKQFLKSVGLKNNKGQSPKKLSKLQTEKVFTYFVRK